jgi:hypothetical protein
MPNTEITEQEYNTLCKRHKQAKYGTAPKEMREDYSVMKFKKYKFITPEDKVTLKIYYNLKVGE